MSKEEIRDTVKSAPFRRFTIRLADGTKYRVPTADHVSISPSGRTLILWKDKGGYRHIDTALILEIDFHEAA